MFARIGNLERNSPCKGPKRDARLVASRRLQLFDQRTRRGVAAALVLARDVFPIGMIAKLSAQFEKQAVADQINIEASPGRRAPYSFAELRRRRPVRELLQEKLLDAIGMTFRCR